MRCSKILPSLVREATPSLERAWRYIGNWDADSSSRFTRKRLRLNSPIAITLFDREVKLPLEYKGRPLESKYCADFICFSSVVVELKALARTSGTEEAQVINYLKATGYQVGLLINFGARSLEHRAPVLAGPVALEYERSVNAQHVGVERGVAAARQ